MFEWIRHGRVSGELYRGRWHNLGTPAQLAQLDAQLRAQSERLIVSEGHFSVCMQRSVAGGSRRCTGPARSVAALAFLAETLYLARRFCGLR